MTTPLENFNQIKLQQTQKALEANGFDVSVHQTLTEAEDYVIDKILPDAKSASVGFGGSATLGGSNLVSRLKQIQGLNVIDRNDPAASPQVRAELSRQTLLTDLFIASSNAVTIEGELINIDKLGNRVAAISYGPKKVALLVGRNKIVSDTHAGVARSKNTAASINSLRLNADTPCSKTAKCFNCKTPSRLCNITVITQRSFPAGRIHILLINQDLGF
ncbi:MAG: lactate utilization protein [Deltaproteobacteria bacterium]|nr:lactate utilization protein [Deltaproteobacteria bacterium]